MPNTLIQQGCIKSIKSDMFIMLQKSNDGENSFDSYFK